MRPLMKSMLTAALFLTCVSITSAQFQAPQIPSPISTKNIDRDAVRLQLSPAQREAVERHHEAYRAAYEALRTTVFEPYSAEHSSLFRPSTLEEVTAARRAFDDVAERLESIEDTFFSQIGEGLSESQAAQLPSVRARRARERFVEMSPMQFRPIRAAQYDLGAIFDQLDLPAPVRASVWPSVEAYETRVTAAARRLHAAALDLPRRTVERQLEFEERQQAAMTALRELSEAASDMPPEQRADWMRTRSERLLADYRSVMEERMTLQRSAQELVREPAEALARTNVEFYKTLAPALPAEAAATLREQFLYRAFPDLPRERGVAADHFERALALEALDTQTRQKLEEDRAAYEADIDRLTDRMLELMQEHGGANLPYIRSEDDRAERNAYDQQLGTLRDQRAKINEVAVATVSGRLGAEHAGVISDLPEVPTVARRVHGITIMLSSIGDRARGGGDGGHRVSIMANEVPASVAGALLASGSSYTPDPITGREIEAWCRSLDLDETQAVLMEALHDDYRILIDETVDADRLALRDQMSSMWGVDAETGDPLPPEPSMIDRVYRLRATILEAIVAADSKFFADVALAVYDDDAPKSLDQLRDRRERAVYGRPGIDAESRVWSMVAGSFQGLGRGDRRGDIDLSRLVDELALTGPAAEAVAPVVEAYVETARDHARRRYASSMQFQAAVEHMVTDHLQAGPPGRFMDLDSNGTFMTAHERHGRAAQASRSSLSDLNDTTLEQVCTLIAPEQARQLRHAWDVARYPSIFAEQHSAVPVLKRALALPDLSPEQRERVMQLVDDFQAGYDAVCAELVELHETRTDVQPNFDGDMEAMKERVRTQRQRYERMRTLGFDRTELRDKTLSRLQRVLDDAQNESLQQLAEAAEE